MPIKRNINTIRKGTVIGIIVIAFITFASTLLLFIEDKTVLYVLVGISIIGLVVFLLFFIPQGQRIEFTRHGIQFYSLGPYTQCRIYHWSEIKGVELRLLHRNSSEKKVIIQMFKSGSNRTNPEDYFEKSISPGVYGYKPEKLYEIIKEELCQYYDSSKLP